MYENVTYGPLHFRLPSWVNYEERILYPRNSTLYQVSDLTNIQNHDSDHVMIHGDFNFKINIFSLSSQFLVLISP